MARGRTRSQRRQGGTNIISPDGHPLGADAGAEERRRELWFDARPLGGPDDPLAGAACNAGLETFLLTIEQLPRFRGRAQRLRLAALIQREEELAGLGPAEVATSAEVALLAKAKERGFATAWYCVIRDQASLRASARWAGGHNYLIIRLVDETNIPLELLLAQFQRAGPCILKEVGTAEEAAVSFGVLDRGVGGVLLRAREVGEVLALRAARDREGRGRLRPVAAEIAELRYVGMGHRACVDTVGLLSPEEGLIVGSVSAGGFLVCSETHPLPYMRPRPFRVNAGAVHSYVWAPGGRAPYLSELEAGAELLCVDFRGGTRRVAVGRVKVEARPLLLVRARAAGVSINVILQDDWHVRLFDPQGAARNVTGLKAGDALVAFLADPGRHVGLPVEEFILET